MGDAVDVILAQWGEVLPDLDVSPMGILGRLSRLTRLVERSQSDVFSAYGLQPGEFDLLATLRRASPPDGLTAGDLARSSMLTSGAITNRVDHLVAKGYVTRDVDPANRRTVQIALTKAGRTLIEKAVVAHVDNERHILAALGARQQSTLARLLRDLLLALGDTPADAAT